MATTKSNKYIHWSFDHKKQLHHGFGDTWNQKALNDESQFYCFKNSSWYILIEVELTFFYLLRLWNMVLFILTLNLVRYSCKILLHTIKPLVIVYTYYWKIISFFPQRLNKYKSITVGTLEIVPWLSADVILIYGKHCVPKRHYPNETPCLNRC